MIMVWYYNTGGRTGVDNRRNRVYAGDTTVGYFAGDSWIKYIWVDQAQKKQLGH
jgi:hypothetical protein